MSTFLTGFLNEDWDDRPYGPRVHLGAFGKHPGWDDHFDLGLNTQSLVALKRLMYSQGISAEIEGQTWEKLPDSGKLPGFDHWFIWVRPTECLIGCLWASRDGKGRSHYPMVLCAHLAHLPLSWGIMHVVPLLKRAAESCRAATTSGRVISTIVDTLDELQSLSATFQINRCNSGMVASSGIAGLSSMFRTNPSLLKPLYEQVLDRFRLCAPGLCNYNSELTRLPCHTLRFPRFEGDMIQNLNAWLGFLLSEIDPGIPTLAIMHNNGSWVDLIAGEPIRGTFHLLRAGLDTLPLATSKFSDDNASLDPLSSRKFAQFESGRLPDISIFNNQLSSHNLRDAIARLNAAKSGRKSLLKRLFAASPNRPNPPLWGD